MRHTCFHIALEPIPSRYSEQWLNCINKEFTKHVKMYHFTEDWSMIDILGNASASTVTSGGFLDFAATHAWKASQVVKIANLFSNGYVTPGDAFLFTDAWNPAILHVKYMSDMLKIPVRLVGYWHAGSYDLWDTFGYRVQEANGNRDWSIASEQALYHALDVNLFATNYHKRFFAKECIHIHDNMDMHQWMPAKMVRSGQPHYEILEWFENRKKTDLPIKENLVVFPHRDCKEKQPEIFDELARRNPKWVFVKTAGMNLSKEAYYDLLLRSKVVFSAAQHEMLGISQMEAVLAHSMPMMPNRLSYSEMYDHYWLYPSEWSMPDTVDIDSLNGKLHQLMSQNHFSAEWTHNFEMHRLRLQTNYMTCKPMWNAIVGAKDVYQ